MPQDSAKGGLSRQDLEEFRALQEEMLNLSREYGQARQEAWAEEMRGLEESWTSFSREWTGTLEQMSGLALSKFEEITTGGEAASNLLSESWKRALTEISGEVEVWGEQVLRTLAQTAGAGPTGWGAEGESGSWTSLIGTVLGFGGWFHQGGVVEAHQGMVISPGALLGDEQLVLAQAGEGILPRESMARLGVENFEALRRGRFEVASGGPAPRFDISIQVQSLDAAGVAGLDWDRLVQRHLLPALQKELGRRW
jgi:hypothetical protein